MSDGKPTPEQLAQQIMSGGPIVSEASQAVGKLFVSTFDALSQNIQTIIKTNDAPDQLTAAVNALTTDMIKLLRSRVDVLFAQAGDAAPGSSPERTGTSDTPSNRKARKGSAS